MSTDNQIDPVVAKRWVGEIERKFDDLASERGSYMAACKEIRTQIGDLKDAAENAGLPKRALNQILKERVLERKLEALRDIEDEDAADLAEQLRTALGDFGDLPLGAAAVEKAEAKTAKAGKGAKGGRKKKATTDDMTAEDAIAAAHKSDPLSTLINDDVPGEKDLRPPFLRDKDQAAAEANAAALAGMKTLN